MRLMGLAAAAAVIAGAAQAGDAPKLVATSPGPGGKVAGGAAVLTATFDRPMTGGSFVLGPRDPPFEVIGQLSLSDDRRTVRLPVRLKPATNYVVWLNSDRHKNFKDDAGTPAEPYRLTFSTTN